MPDRPPEWTIEIPITEQSQVGQARRSAQSLAHALSMSPEDAGRAAVIATELATNILKHAGSGTILLGTSGTALQILAVDRGRGIASVGRALQDGFSTAGSPGTGFGAIQRQSDLFVTLTSAVSGTAILSCVGTRDPISGRIAAISAPVPGESRNGDSWCMRRSDGRLLLAVIDGLGHGDLAAEASAAACGAFASSSGGAADVLRRIHDALRPTRGAAAAVIEIDSASGKMVYAGIGNVAATIVAPGVRRSAVSMYGIVGHQIRDIREFTYDVPPGALLIVHTDGISARWDLADPAALSGTDPGLIAALVWRDHRRHTDDATVVVARI